MRRIVAICCGRIAPIPATINSPASVGWAMSADHVRKTRARMTSMQDTAEDARPSGSARRTPRSRRSGRPSRRRAGPARGRLRHSAMPCAAKSRLELLGAPPSFGADWATPAPWTSTIAMTASAPDNVSNEKSLQAGSAGIGRPDGIAPASRTRATLSAPATMTTTVGRTRRDDRRNRRFSGVRRNTMIKAGREGAGQQATRSRSARDGMRALIALARLIEPDAETPRRFGICPRTMLAATPVRKPVMTEWDTNLV